MDYGSIAYQASSVNDMDFVPFPERALRRKDGANWGSFLGFALFQQPHWYVALHKPALPRYLNAWVSSQITTRAMMMLARKIMRAWSNSRLKSIMMPKYQAAIAIHPP